MKHTLVFGIFALATLTGSRSPAPVESSTGIANSLALRARYGAAVPVSVFRVIADSVSVHHIKTEYSTIAWRNADGRWEVSLIGEDGPGGLVRMEPEVIPEKRSIVALKDGTELDHLLDDPRLYSDRARYSVPKYAVGVAEHTMEITTPTGHIVLRWVGRLKGRAGKVADIVLGKG